MIYFIEAVGVGNIKIGFTDHDDAAIRLAQLQTGSPVPLRLLGTISGTMEDEKNLQRQFAAERVCGEWFRPVPELVALIPVAGLPSCGKVEVTQQTVAIRVLTVGRKQFTKALLEQLPVAKLVDWENLVCRLDAKIPAGGSWKTLLMGFNLADHIDGDIWGWVKADGKKANSFYPSRWVLFVRGGLLYKHLDRSDTPERYRSVAIHVADGHRMSSLLDEIYPLRNRIVGWREEDRLYYGV